MDQHAPSVSQWRPRRSRRNRRLRALDGAAAGRWTAGAAALPEPRYPPVADVQSLGVSVFGRILVGVDGTDWGFEALRQALVLADEDAVVRAVAAAGQAAA